MEKHYGPKKLIKDISLTTPRFVYSKCCSSLLRSFKFEFNGDKIKGISQCSYCNKTIHFNVNNLYTKEKINQNTYENLSEIIPNTTSPLFPSTNDLYQFVSEKLHNNIQYKNKLKERIRKSNLKEEYKEIFYQKINESYDKNLKINIECYKILHYILYIDLQLREKGAYIQFNNKVNFLYSFSHRFDLVEKTVYKLLSFYQYQYLIKFDYIHEYSMENSFFLNDKINIELVLFDGLLLGSGKEDLIEIYQYSANDKKLIRQNSLYIDDSIIKCIQLNSGEIFICGESTLKVISLQYYTDITSIKFEGGLLSFCYKTSNGKIIVLKEEETEETFRIYKYNSNKKILELEVALKIMNPDSLFPSCEIQENKIVINNEYLCIYNCEIMQYEAKLNILYSPCSNYYFNLFDNQFVFLSINNNCKIKVVDSITYDTICECDVERGLSHLFTSNHTVYVLPVTKKEMIIANDTAYRLDPFNPEKSHYHSNKTSIYSFSYVNDGRALIGFTKYLQLISFDEEETITDIDYQDQDKFEYCFTARSVNALLEHEIIVICGDKVGTFILY